jgi:hypothetical protein
MTGRTATVITLCLLVRSSPADDKSKATRVTYEEHVAPILREHCLACHDQDKARGGLSLNSYSGIMTGGSSGEVIKPGSAEDSRLYLLISHKETPNMPPKSPMIPSDRIETLRRWIEGGALQNSGSKPTVAKRPTFEMAVSTVAKGKPAGPPPMPKRPLLLEPVVRTARANALTALAASPWAPLLAIGGQKQVLLYRSDTLDLLGILPFPEGVPYVLRFSRNGSLLLAGGGQSAKCGKVAIWDVAKGERILTIGDETDAVLAADISPDQSEVALGGPSKVVRIFSTSDSKLVREIRKHTDWIYALEYSPDGLFLASGDRSGGLYVWEAHTAREYFNLRGHTGSITAVSWRPDSDVLASSSEDGTIRLWEMENGTQIKSWNAHAGGALSLSYAHDGRLASCGRDHVARLWQTNGAPLRGFEPFPDIALRTCFSHDDRRIVAGDWTGQIRVWNAADGKRIGNLIANPASVAKPQFHAASH